MKVETIEIAGMAAALTALRLPFGKEVRSEIKTETLFLPCLEATKDGWPPINAVWKNSARVEIDPKDLALMNTLLKRGTEHAKVLRGIVVWAKITAPIYWWCEGETYVVGHQRLSSESTMHIDCQGLSGDELQEAKAKIPMGKELTKVDFFSYQCLRNIYKQRKDHRLKEWHTFCDWIDTLPFAKELITYGLCEDKDQSTETTK